MKKIFTSILLNFIWLPVISQTTVYVRNSTWQNFDVEAGQYGTVSVPVSEWQTETSTVEGWLESTGQEVLTVNRTNAAVPEGDTAYFDIVLNGTTDGLTIKLRVIGLNGSTELDYSIEGDGFSEPWYDDGDFHEVSTTLAGKPVIIKFKPDNDDQNFDRDIRFAIHDLPVYELNAADHLDPNILNVMFYNIQMITFGVSGMPQANERAALLPAQISEYQDVVCYSEVFDDVAREDHLIPAMTAAGFPYRTSILNEPSGLIPFPVNGGVMIFSRWPIEVEDEIDFAECGQAASDCLANKGIKYARINKLGKRYHVFGTHMDAGSGEDDVFARRTQMAEMRDFIGSLQIPQSEPVIFGGDFNTDPISSDMDYRAFLDTMNPIIPQHIGYWESNFSGDFGKVIDHGWGDRYHLVPLEMTNEIITVRSLDPVLWDLSEFSDHRCVLARYAYPDISMSGGDTLICPGNDLTLSVLTDFPVSYQWMRNGEPLEGQNSSELQLMDAQESQTGQYSCEVRYDVVYGNWPDALNALFYPDGIDTVQARLSFDFGQVVIDEVLCQVGIDEVSGSGYVVFPNPVSETLNVVVSEDFSDAEYVIYNSLGKQVRSGMLGADRSSIDVAEMSDGVYIITIQKDGKRLHQRFVVY